MVFFYQLKDIRRGERKKKKHLRAKLEGDLGQGGGVLAYKEETLNEKGASYRRKRKGV